MPGAVRGLTQFEHDRHWFDFPSGSIHFGFCWTSYQDVSVQKGY